MGHEDQLFIAEATNDARSLKNVVDEAEWVRRVDLACVYRLVAHFGWDDLFFTHISARADDGGDNFLLNPFGMRFDEVTASNLVKVDMDGVIVDGARADANPAGFVIHSAVHALRGDHEFVAHLHTKDGVAVSAQAHGLLPISQQAMLIGEPAYHDFEGPALDQEECSRIQTALGDKKIMMLRNHGTLVTGESASALFLRVFLLENACAIQIRALAGGSALYDVKENVRLETYRVGEGSISGGLSDTLWPSMRRYMDQIDASYKE